LAIGTVTLVTAPSSRAASTVMSIGPSRKNTTLAKAPLASTAAGAPSTRTTSGDDSTSTTPRTSIQSAATTA
jgi:hypothetical protein